jgi:bacteriorhodopsin
MIEVIARNLLIGGGAYYLSWWLAYPLALGYGKLTERIVYRGDFAGAVVMPLVTGLPYAVVAVGVGASVAWLVDSEQPLRWAMFPAALYAFFAFFGHHWASPPKSIDREAQVIGALFLAVACLAGAMVATRRKIAPRIPANSR